VGFFLRLADEVRAELDAHAVILAHLFRLIESGVISQPLQQEDPSLSNVVFVQQFIAKTLMDAFPHLQQCVFIFIFFIIELIVWVTGRNSVSSWPVSSRITWTGRHSRAICATF
jgi:hypothetical protein